MNGRYPRGWLLSMGFWTICGIVCGLQIFISMITHGHSVARILAYQLLVWNAWFFIAIAVRELARRVPLVPASRRAVLWHLLAATILGTAHTTFWTFLLVTMRPYDAMNPRRFGPAWASIGFSTMPCEYLLYGGVVACAYAIDYYAKFRERELRAAQLETSLAEARLHALELQIQPHFLFNTLNSISSLVRAGRNDAAVVMIAGLSDLLRYTLDHAGEQRVTMETETDMVRRYLEIQQTRFADRLVYQIDVDDDVHQARVPTLILQPLAENAIRHGIAMSAAPGRVSVRAFRDEGRLKIEVFNTGRLRQNATEGIGLRNTMARLRQLYGEDQMLSIGTAGDGVLVSVSLPLAEAA